MRNSFKKKKHPRLSSPLNWVAASLISQLVNAEVCPKGIQLDYGKIFEFNLSTTQTGTTLQLEGPENNNPSDISSTSSCVDISYSIEEAKSTDYSSFPKLSTTNGGVVNFGGIYLDSQSPPGFIIPDFTGLSVVAGTYIFVLSAQDALGGSVTTPEVKLNISGPTAAHISGPTAALDPCSEVALHASPWNMPGVSNYYIKDAAIVWSWEWSNVVAEVSADCTYSMQWQSKLNGETNALEPKIFTNDDAAKTLTINVPGSELVEPFKDLIGGTQALTYRVGATNTATGTTGATNTATGTTTFTEYNLNESEVLVMPGSSCPITVDNCVTGGITYDYSQTTEIGAANFIVPNSCTDPNLVYECESDASNPVDLCTAPPSGGYSFDSQTGLFNLSGDASVIPTGTYTVTIIAYSSYDGNAGQCTITINAADLNVVACASPVQSIAWAIGTTQEYYLSTTQTGTEIQTTVPPIVTLDNGKTIAVTDPCLALVYSIVETNQISTSISRIITPDTVTLDSSNPPKIVFPSFEGKYIGERKNTFTISVVDSNSGKSGDTGGYGLNVHTECAPTMTSCQEGNLYEFNTVDQLTIQPGFTSTCTGGRQTTYTCTQTGVSGGTEDLCTYNLGALVDLDSGEIVISTGGIPSTFATYSITLAGQFTNSNVQTTCSFQIRVRSPCDTSARSLKAVPFSNMSFNIGDAALQTQSLTFDDLINDDPIGNCNYAIHWSYEENGESLTAAPVFISETAIIPGLEISTVYGITTTSLVVNYKIEDTDFSFETPWTTNAFTITINAEPNANCTIFSIDHDGYTYDKQVLSITMSRDLGSHPFPEYYLKTTNCQNVITGLSSFTPVIAAYDYTKYLTADFSSNFFTLTGDLSSLIANGGTFAAQVGTTVNFDVYVGVTLSYQSSLTVNIINPCMLAASQAIVPDADQQASFDYAVGTGDLDIEFPSFTAVADFCGQLSVNLGAFDPNLIDGSGKRRLAAAASDAITVLGVTDESLVGTYTVIEFIVTLDQYPTDAYGYALQLDFPITVNYVECIVDSSDVVTPVLENVEIDKADGVAKIIDFLGFKSTSAETCGFTDWTYKLTLSSLEVDASSLEVADFVALNSDLTQIEVFQITTKPPSETLTVTVTGTLMTKGDPVEETVSFDIKYLAAFEEKSILLPFAPAGFENPIDSTIVFDLADTADLEFELGQITTFDGSAFDVSFRSPTSFIKILEEKGSHWIKVNRDQAQGGSYSLTVTISVELGLRSKEVVIKIQVDIVDSRPTRISGEVTSEATETEAVSEDGTAEESASVGVSSSASSTTSSSKYDVTTPIQTSYSKKFQNAPVEVIEQHNDEIVLPRIIRIEQTGNLELVFSKERFIEAEGVEVNTKESRRRRLQDIDEEEDDELDDELFVDKIYGEQTSGEAVKGLQLWVEPGEMTDKEMIKFTYSVNQFSDDGIQIQLKFENPDYVSATLLKDELVVSMVDFRDKEGNLIAEDQVIRQNIPNQVDPDVGVILAGAGAAASNAVGASVSLNLFFNLLMKTSMNQMLGSIKNLQVIVHLCLMEVIVPGNAQIFISKISEMIAFDPIDLELYFGDTFSIYEEEIELPDNFVQLGYESAYFLSNMGSLTYIIALQIFLFSLLALLAGCPCCFTKVRNWSGNKLDECFFNGILAFIDGTFLVVLLMAAITLKQSIDGNVKKDFSFWCSIVVIVVCLFEMICVTYFFCKNYKQLGEKKNLKRCGYIYEDLNWKIRGWTTLLYPLMYQMRFLLLIATVIYLKDYLVFQVLIIILATVAIMINLGTAHPYAVVRRNYTALFSEFTIVVVMDLLLFSSDPNISLKGRMIIGWTITGILGLSIALSQGSLLIGIICQTITKCRLRHAKKLNQKNLEAKRIEQSGRKEKKVRFNLDGEAEENESPRGRENQIDREDLSIVEEEDSDGGELSTPRNRVHNRKRFGMEASDDPSIDSQQSVVKLLGQDKTTPQKRARAYADEAVDDELIRVQKQNPGLATLKPAPIQESQSRKTQRDMVEKNDGLVLDLDMSSMISDGFEKEDCAICRINGETCILCGLKDEQRGTKIDERVTAKNSERGREEARN